MRTFIIGDIHGCYDELMQLLRQINIQPEDLLISVGDIVDRGPKSLETWQFFRDRPNSIVLMGNHERKHLNGILSYAQEIVRVQFGADYPAFVAWTQTLPYYYETPEAIVVHAAFEHDQSLAQQREDVLCGATAGDRYLQSRYASGTSWSDYYQGQKPLVYGHHVVGDDAKYLHNTIGIDTGCCHGGLLTALELPGFEMHQLRAEKDYWREQQQLWQIPVLQSKPWETMTFENIHKQFEKLAYIQEPAVVALIQNLRSWLEALDQLLNELLQDLSAFARALSEQHGPDFNRVAATYFFQAFLFKSKSDNLPIAELAKKLDTPEKRIVLADALGIKNRAVLRSNYL